MSTTDKVVEAAGSINLAGVTDKALAYTQQFIEAATPVAKQAYEIGLLTLQIDALSTVVPDVIGLILSLWGTWYLFKTLRHAHKTACDFNSRYELSIKVTGYRHLGHYLPTEGVIPVLLFIGAASYSTVCLLNLSSVWLWVKLFQPELWLAHQAIQTLIK